jgi:hypothetical protein
MPFLSPMAWAKPAQGDADVFDGMVVVDMQVALALDIQVDQPVTGDLVQHVLKERHTDIESGLSGAIEVDRALIWVSRVLRSTDALRSTITSSAKSLGEKGSHYRPRTRQLETRMTYGKAGLRGITLQVYTGPLQPQNAGCRPERRNAPLNQ